MTSTWGLPLQCAYPNNKKRSFVATDSHLTLHLKIIFMWSFEVQFSINFLKKICLLLSFFYSGVLYWVGALVLYTSRTATRTWENVIWGSTQVTVYALQMNKPQACIFGLECFMASSLKNAALASYSCRQPQLIAGIALRSVGSRSGASREVTLVFTSPPPPPPPLSLCEVFTFVYTSGKFEAVILPFLCSFKSINVNLADSLLLFPVP